MSHTNVIIFADKDSSRAVVKDLLSESTPSIFKFTKADGSVRELRGTTNPNIMPEDALTDSSGDREPNDNVQVVYDLEVNGWRAFRWDRLISIETSNHRA